MGYESQDFSGTSSYEQEAITCLGMSEEFEDDAELWVARAQVFATLHLARITSFLEQ